MKFMARVNPAKAGEVKSDVDLTTESIFRQILDERYTMKSLAESSDPIKELHDLQSRLEEQNKLRVECLRLAKLQDDDVRDTVTDLLQSGSKYLNLKGLA